MYFSCQMPTSFSPCSFSTTTNNSTIAFSSTFCCCLSKRAVEITTANGHNRVGVGGGGGGGGGGVHVPRQKYIAISKSELLDAIVSMFDSRQEKDDFLLMSSCLDSILHAEHKSILEEMRIDYDLTHSIRPETNSHKGACSEGNLMPNGKDSAMDLFDLLGSSTKNDIEKSRVPVDTRFQRAFVQLLYNAQFEELSAADLMLTSALNTNYLLTLPVYVDWKRASESKAIIFRRGYATERQKGLLIVEKLDYLQSRLLQGIFFGISKPLRKIGMWFVEAFRSSIPEQDAEVWIKRIKLWFKEVPLFKELYFFDEPMRDDMLGVDQLSDKDLPIWLAAQRAVARYEGILSSAGPRGRLLRKLLTWTGLINPMPERIFDLDSDDTTSEPYLRPIFLSRISLSDIWEPVSRRFRGNDLWNTMKDAFSILLSRSILQEPAFQELILLYTEEMDDKEIIDQAKVPLLQLKIYERIPIPDLPVIFPHKKLSFRILDTVRLDAATILGLLAYFINYKFENILSSPSAILLDVIAVSALVIYVSRIVLGYKQTWDRYQLLVNRALYEKTVASGFGSVHFLLDASEQQQYKEAILAYAILLKDGGTWVTFAESLGDKCERFMYDVFGKKVIEEGKKMLLNLKFLREKFSPKTADMPMNENCGGIAIQVMMTMVEMPIDKAANTLKRLGLVIEKEVNGRVGLLAIPCPKAYVILKQRWNSFLS